MVLEPRGPRGPRFSIDSRSWSARRDELRRRRRLREAQEIAAEVEFPDVATPSTPPAPVPIDLSKDRSDDGGFSILGGFKKTGKGLLAGLDWYHQNIAQPAGSLVTVTQEKPVGWQVPLGQLVTGEMSIPEAVRQLREAQQERGGVEQFITETVSPVGIAELAFGGGIFKGLTTAAKARPLLRPLVPLAFALEKTERAAQVASEVPFRMAGTAAKSIPLLGKPLSVAGRQIPPLFKESKKSIVRNTLPRTQSALNRLRLAGAGQGESYSSVLREINTGNLDQPFFKTLDDPHDIETLSLISKHRKKLRLDELAEMADADPHSVSTQIGDALSHLRGTELGVVTRKAPTIPGSKLASDIYNAWRSTVLFTPWYILQVTVENPIRIIERGGSIPGSPDDIFRYPFSQRSKLALRPFLDVLQGKAGSGLSGAEFMSETMSRGLPTGKFAKPATIIGRFPRAWNAWFDDRALVKIMVSSFRRARDELTSKNPVLKAHMDDLEKIFASNQNRIAVGADEDTWLLMKDVAMSNVEGKNIRTNLNDLSEKWWRGVTYPQGVPTIPISIENRGKTAVPGLMREGNEASVNTFFRKLEEELADGTTISMERALLDKLRILTDEMGSKLSPSARDELKDHIARLKRSTELDDVAVAAMKDDGQTLNQKLFNAAVVSNREKETIAFIKVATAALADTTKPGKEKAASTIHRFILDTLETNRRHFQKFETFPKDTLNLSRAIARNDNQLPRLLDEYYSKWPQMKELLGDSEVGSSLLWATYRRSQEMLHSERVRGILQMADIDATDLLKTPLFADAVAKQVDELRAWRDQVLTRMRERAAVTPQATKEATDVLTKRIIEMSDKVALEKSTVLNKAIRFAEDDAFATMGNYGTRTNLDEVMNRIMPFWYFPSRSIPFYAKLGVRRPGWYASMRRWQEDNRKEGTPDFLAGYIPIPGTPYSINPLRPWMAFQLTAQTDWLTPSPPLPQKIMEQIQAMSGMSLGPQFQIGLTFLSRFLEDRGYDPLIDRQPRDVIPQQRWIRGFDNWLSDVAPEVRLIANVLNEPSDMFLRFVYGDEVATWHKRRVEQYLVEMGVDPTKATDEETGKALRKVGERDLAGIPFGAVKVTLPKAKERQDEIAANIERVTGFTPDMQLSLRNRGDNPLSGLRNDQIQTIFATDDEADFYQHIRPLFLKKSQEAVWETTRAYNIDLRRALDRRKATIAAAEERLRDGAINPISPERWKRLVSDAYNQYAGAIESLQHPDGMYATALKTSADWDEFNKELGKERIRHPDDLAFQRYMEEVDADDYTDAAGDFDVRAWRKTQDAFRESVDDDTWAYIQSRLRKNKSPLELERQLSLEAYQEYFEMVVPVIKRFKNSEELQRIYDEYDAQPFRNVRDAMADANPDLKEAIRIITLVKQALRKRNPEMEAFLLKFGYIDSILAPENEGRIDEIRIYE